MKGNMINLLITGAFSCEESDIKKLEELKIKVSFHKDEKENVENAGLYDAVICNGLFLYNDIKKFENLKYIQLTSAGYDRVPMEYIKEHNIEIYNARGVYSIPIAEWTLTKILELYKKSRDFYIKQENKLWEKEREIFELYGKTAVIVGCGSIGTEIAKRLKAFDTKVFGVDIYKPNESFFDEYYDIKNIDEAIKKADLIISSVPITEATYHLFDKEKFDIMNEQCVFCNFSRGKVVNEQDLISALEDKKIYGAILDVFEEEPLDKKSKLWNMENVILTPHNSFVGVGNKKRMFEVAYRNFREWNDVQ